MNNLYFNEHFVQITIHYALQLVYLIYKRNERSSYINLKGFRVITIKIFFITPFLPTL